RRGPGIAFQADDPGVADLALAASAVGHDHALVGKRRIGGAAVAGGSIQRPLTQLRAIRSMDRGAQHHRRATTVVMAVVTGGTCGGLLPAVEPGDAKLVFVVLPEGHEAMVAA